MMSFQNRLLSNALFIRYNLKSFGATISFQVFMTIRIFLRLRFGLASGARVVLISTNNQRT